MRIEQAELELAAACLLANTYDAVSASGGTVRVRCANGDDDTVRVEISHDGAPLSTKARSRVFDARLDTLLAEDNPQITYYGAEGDLLFEEMADHPAAGTLEEFLTERGLLIGRLEKLSLEEWHRPGRHPEFDNYDVHLQMDYLAHHEAHHVYQIFQRRTPLGPVPAGG